MAKAKESTIIYHNQMSIVRKWLDTEQIGRLMVALFEFEDGGDPEVDADIGLAFDFLSLQAKIDREKYEKKCETNRENGRKGGAKKGNQNARKQPKQPNAKKNNPNDDDDENDDENENDDEKEAGTAAVHSSDFIFSSFGKYGNVELTQDQMQELEDRFERSGALIDKVSDWLKNAKNKVPDHFSLCLKFAKNEEWPKRRPREVVEPIVAKDPLDPEEQRRMVADLKQVINGAFASG